MNAPSAQQAIDHARHSRDRVLGELRKVIVGQEDLIDQVFIAMCAGGHVLLVGVPGLAKTLLVSTLAKTLSMHFKRIQFTPDMMPSDITGTEILEEDHSTGKKQFVFVQGPVFTNLLLADEINRTPPKTQAALLEAMQEKSITVGKKTYKLDEPFMVMATQNPIEQEGTYPLPEAQLDRFMFNLYVDYPSDVELKTIIRNTTAGGLETPDSVLTRDASQQGDLAGHHPEVSRLGCRSAGRAVSGLGREEPGAFAGQSAGDHRRRAGRHPRGLAASHLHQLHRAGGRHRRRRDDRPAAQVDRGGAVGLGVRAAGDGRGRGFMIRMIHMIRPGKQSRVTR